MHKTLILTLALLVTGTLVTAQEASEGAGADALGARLSSEVAASSGASEGDEGCELCSNAAAPEGIWQGEPYCYYCAPYQSSSITQPKGERCQETEQDGQDGSGIDCFHNCVGGYCLCNTSGGACSLVIVIGGW